MATWVNEVTTSSGGNISLIISGGYAGVWRNGSSIGFSYGVRFTMSSSTYTYNSIAAFVGGTRYYAFNSGSGASHTTKGTWYYAGGETPFGWSGTASGTGSGSVTISVGTGWNAWTPSNNYTYSFSVPYPAAASYTVSYNANGGSGAPGSQTKYQGYTLTLSSTRPTRSGYEFLGWSTSSSGSVSYSPGSSYTSDSGTTLYAIWKSLEPVFSAPSLSRTETTISWGRFNANINSNFYYKLDSGSWVGIGSGTTTGSSGSVSGLTPGTSHTITFRADNASSTSLQTTHSNSTTTYNYPYIQSIGNSNITIGSSQTISLYNPLSRSVSVSIYTVDGKTGTYGSAVSTTTTSATITIPTTAVATKFTTKTSAPIVYRATYSGHTSDYSGTVNVTAATAGPTIDANKKNGFFTYADVATFVSGSTYSMSTYTGSDQKLLRGYSKLRYSLVSSSNPFGGQYDATISSYKVQINSKTATTTTIGTNYYEGSSGGTTSSGSAVVVTDQNYTITISATDTRGLTNSYTIPITTYSYAKPVVSISSAVREGGFSPNVTINISGTWCPNMNGAHTARTITLSYKKTSDSTYTTKTLYQDSGSTSYYQLSRTVALSGISFDSNAAYYMYIDATDGLGQTTRSITFTLSPGVPIMMIDAAMTGVGVNMLPEGKGLYVSEEVVVTNNVIINGNRVVKITKSTAEPSGGVDGDVWIKYN